MLVVLHAKGFPQIVTNVESLGKRLNGYVSKYSKHREAPAMKTDSSAGVTWGDLCAGMSLEDKLGKICPHFEIMHALYIWRMC